MKIVHTAFFLFFLLNHAVGQNIDFNDHGLKNYLINEPCIDTSNASSFTAHIDIDVNDDGEIQVTEANAVKRLVIADLNNAYSIKSVQDLNMFQNLEWLKIINVDSIFEIADLGLDSLNSLWIGSNYNLRVIDLSDLTNLSASLRIEDQDTLYHLNIQNGSVPQYFSMFYTEKIVYACVDSIASEYDDIAWRMISGTPNIDQCEHFLNVNDLTDKTDLFQVYPNPTEGFIDIRSESQINEVRIITPLGQVAFQAKDTSLPIDITFLPAGLYMLIATDVNGRVQSKRIEIH